MNQIFMQFCPDFEGKMLQFSRLQILCGPKHNQYGLEICTNNDQWEVVFTSDRR